MNKKILIRSFLVFFFLLVLISVYLNNKKENEEAVFVETTEEKYSSSNIMKNVNYVSKDDNGNELHKDILRINLSGHTTYDGLIDYVDNNEPKIILVDSSRGKNSVKLASDLTKTFSRPGISMP